uniref:PARG helical domain-containing protein n=1 Tax=Timema douglasi TaxID=61478 RepID=A0A7R8Z7X3_TIMDO|nr:unnamed protein product [Timema douglasi]
MNCNRMKERRNKEFLIYNRDFPENSVKVSKLTIGSLSEKKKDCKSNVVSRPLTPDMFEEDFPSVPETMNYPDVALQIEGVESVDWDISSLLCHMYYLFTDSPTRRALFTQLTGCASFPLKFCGVRWLENAKCFQRALQIWDHVVKFLKEAKLLKIKPVETLKRAACDPFLKCKLAFFKTIADECQTFLQRFRTSKPMTPYLFEAVEKLLRYHMNRCVKPDLMKCTGETAITVTERQKLEFIHECRSMLTTMIAKLLERSPLKQKAVRGLSSLDPCVIQHSPQLGQKRFSFILEELNYANIINDVLAENAKKEYLHFCNLKKSQLQEIFRPCDQFSDEVGLDTIYDDLETEESASPPSVAPWRGTAMSELKNRYSPGLPPVQASANHTVLFQLPVSPGCPLKPYPHVSKDRWDSLHVRMPSSSLSLYPVENAGKDGEEKQLRPRWELVQEALLKPIPSSKQLQDAIFSYNSKYSSTSEQVEEDSRDAKPGANLKEAKTGEDLREAKTEKDSKEDKTGENSKEAKTEEDLREAKTGKDSREAKTGKDSREAKTGEDLRDAKPREKLKEAKTGKDSREAKTEKGSRDAKPEENLKGAKTLEDLRESKTGTLLPQIIGLALQLPSLVTGPIPLLVQHRNQSVSLTQLQVASLLANAFLCTFPRRNTAKRFSEYYKYPDINFNRLFHSSQKRFSCCIEKLRCLIHYFHRVCTKSPVGVLTYSRQYLSSSQLPDWTSSKKFLPQLHISSSGTIEKEGDGFLQVDFANKYAF